jgi:hypothetical protein
MNFDACESRSSRDGAVDHEAFSGESDGYSVILLFYLNGRGFDSLHRSRKSHGAKSLLPCMLKNSRQRV